MHDSKADQLSQMIEREVRQTIGDLHMQIVVLRCLAEVQQPREQPREQPNPPPEPPEPAHPPGRPGPSPDLPPVPPTRSPQPDPARNTKSNGRYQEKIAQ